MMLSEHFSLKEMIFSQNATRYNIKNYPGEAEMNNLKRLCALLERVRAMLGKPVRVSSGYRCKQVNQIVNGDPKSQHLIGCASDFDCDKFGTPRQIVDKIKAAGIEFDQLILEYDEWVHISVPAPLHKARKEVLIRDHSGTRKY